MSVIAYTIVRPRDGKRAVVEDRSRRAGAIYAKHGSEVKVSRIVAGPLTECITVQRKYANFSAAAKAFSAIGSDADFAQLQSERQADPAGDFLVGREIIRTVYGDTSWDTHPISHLRVYEVSRDKLAGALALFPEVEKLVSASGVNVVGLVPITGENMSTLTIAYQAKSIEHWGEVLDTIGTSEEFQALIARAADFGTIRRSGVMVPL